MTPKVVLVCLQSYTTGCNGVEDVFTQSNLPVYEMKLTFMHLHIINERTQLPVDVKPC